MTCSIAAENKSLVFERLVHLEGDEITIIFSSGAAS